MTNMITNVDVTAFSSFLRKIRNIIISIIHSNFVFLQLRMISYLSHFVMHITSSPKREFSRDI